MDEAVENVAKVVTDIGHCYTDIVGVHRNEKGAGDGTKKSGAKRDETPPASKSLNDDYGHEKVTVVRESLSPKSGMDHSDGHPTYRLASAINRDCSEDDSRDIRCVTTRSCDDGKARVTGISNPTMEYTETPKKNSGDHLSTN